jgi:hypothetical protein
MTSFCYPEYPIFYTRDWLKCIRTCSYSRPKSICGADAEIRTSGELVIATDYRTHRLTNIPVPAGEGTVRAPCTLYLPSINPVTVTRRRRFPTTALCLVASQRPIIIVSARPMRGCPTPSTPSLSCRPDQRMCPTLQLHGLLYSVVIPIP